MADKKQSSKKKVADLKKSPLKAKSAKDAKDVKGGAMGPGTQTEDDIYVGVRRR